MNRNTFARSGLLLASIVFSVACGAGGGGSGSDTSNNGVNSQGASSAPLAGQFLAACMQGAATIQGFVTQTPLADGSGGLPSAEEVLASGNPNTIPVIGGLVSAGGGLDAIPVDETLAMIPSGGLSGSLPIVGTAPVVCGTAALALSQLPDPTRAPGLIPVFDETGDPVALILATVGAGSPVDDLGLPVGTDTLPAPLADAVAPLLALLSPSSTPTPGASPTPTPSSGQPCFQPYFPCPSGQVCVGVPGDWGTCQGL